VFADAYYLLGLINASDEAHEKVQEFSRVNASPLVTTTWILTELGDALHRPRHRPAFVSLLRAIQKIPRLTWSGLIRICSKRALPCSPLDPIRSGHSRIASPSSSWRNRSSRRPLPPIITSSRPVSRSC